MQDFMDFCQKGLSADTFDLSEDSNDFLKLLLDVFGIEKKIWD